MNSTSTSVAISPVERVIKALESRGFDPRETGSGWRSRCPVHNGDSSCLSITEGVDGKVLLHCNHGEQECTTGEICQSLGLQLRDLFLNPSGASRESSSKKMSKGKKAPVSHPTFELAIQAYERHLGAKTGQWTYEDQYGSPCFHVCRFDPPGERKQFRPFHQSKTGWVVADPPGLLPLYRLPQVKASSLVLVVEGEKCVEAAESIGFVATTNAHGAQAAEGTDWSALSGKHIVICPDKDAAGEKWLEVCLDQFAKLEHPPASVKRIELPGLTEKGDDLVDWLELRDAPEPEALKSQLLAIVDQTEPLKFALDLQPRKAETPRLNLTKGVNEAPDDPHRLGRTFVKEHYDHPEHPLLVHHAREFHFWRDGCYRRIPEDGASQALTAGIKSQFDADHLKERSRYREAKAEADRLKAEGKTVLASTPKEPVARKVTGKIHSDTMRALQSMVAIPHEQDEPFWLGNNSHMPAPKDILPTPTGLVDLSSLRFSNDMVDLAQINVIKPTPLFFSHNVLRYSFDPQAPKPARWIQFIEEVFPGDQEAQRELQKWFGLLITPDTSYQKILMLTGKSRSGKGTILRILTRLLGESNMASPGLAELGNPHVLEDCVGKSVMLIADARITKDCKDLALIQERLLKISGEDAVQINPKNKKMFTTKLPLRIVLAAQTVPAFRETHGEFRARLRPIHFSTSFEGREDFGLEGKLVAEMPGILNWAIEGKAKLAKDGNLFIPESAAPDLKTLENPNAIALFLEECCDLTDAAFISPKEDIYQGYQWWCEKTGNKQPKAIQVFGQMLHTLSSTIKDTRPRLRDELTGEERRTTAYQGIRLLEYPRRESQNWAIRRN